MERNGRRLLSIMQAADRLGVSRAQMVELVENGVIASTREGWHMRVVADDICALLQLPRCTRAPDEPEFHSGSDQIDGVCKAIQPSDGRMAIDTGEHNGE